jgi:hypothetical protein
MKSKFKEDELREAEEEKLRLKSKLTHKEYLLNQSTLTNNYGNLSNL